MKRRSPRMHKSRLSSIMSRRYVYTGSSVFSDLFYLSLRSFCKVSLCYSSFSLHLMFSSFWFAAPRWKADLRFFIESPDSEGHMCCCLFPGSFLKAVKKKRAVVIPRLSVVGLWLVVWRRWVDWQARRQSVGQPRHLLLLFTMLGDWHGCRHSPNLQPKQGLTTALCTQLHNTNCYGSIFYHLSCTYNHILSLQFSLMKMQ